MMSLIAEQLRITAGGHVHLGFASVPLFRGPYDSAL